MTPALQRASLFSLIQSEPGAVQQQSGPAQAFSGVLEGLLSLLQPPSEPTEGNAHESGSQTTLWSPSVPEQAGPKQNINARSAQRGELRGSETQNQAQQTPLQVPVTLLGSIQIPSTPAPAVPAAPVPAKQDSASAQVEKEADGAQPAPDSGTASTRESRPSLLAGFPALRESIPQRSVGGQEPPVCRNEATAHHEVDQKVSSKPDSNLESPIVPQSPHETQFTGSDRAPSETVEAQPESVPLREHVDEQAVSESPRAHRHVAGKQVEAEPAEDDSETGVEQIAVPPGFIAPPASVSLAKSQDAELRAPERKQEVRRSSSEPVERDPSIPTAWVPPAVPAPAAEVNPRTEAPSVQANAQRPNGQEKTQRELPQLAAISPDDEPTQRAEKPVHDAEPPQAQHMTHVPELPAAPQGFSVETLSTKQTAESPARTKAFSLHMEARPERVVDAKPATRAADSRPVAKHRSAHVMKPDQETPVTQVETSASAVQAVDKAEETATSTERENTEKHDASPASESSVHVRHSAAIHVEAEAPHASHAQQSSAPEPAAPTAPSAMLDRIEEAQAKPTPSAPLKEITLQVSRGSEVVDIQVRGDGDKVDVAVATNQELLASTLRHDLPSLVESLHTQGYEATPDTPAPELHQAAVEAAHQDQPLSSHVIEEYAGAGRFDDRERQHHRRQEWPEED